ncbi:MAG: flagellar hook protein FlgE [Rhodoferax sp.]|nr:flagellar hook protein FlgE [Rhodoferax sp.]
MTFQTGLAGLNASTKRLDIIGNNIANANTVGAKSSRAEFAALVSSAGAAGSNEGEGIGVAVSTVSQQFTQGSINITGNSLDVAINGGGFFQITTPEGKSAYTRDGQFKLDRQGFVVTNQGANLMGYQLDATGTPTSITPQKLTVPTGAPIAASATANITLEMNLDARAPVAASVTPPTPRTTYGTSLVAYDSQGIQIPVNLYFERVASTTTDNWNVYDVATGGTSLFQLQFDSSGALVSPATSPTLTIATPGTITPDISATLDIGNATQYSSSFAVTKLTQDGYTAGDLTGVSIDQKGILTTTYTNGQTKRLAQITLADFRNPQGLTPISGGAWVETYKSGQPIQGKPSEGKFGELRSGALEDSNVDLTAELVAMMTAQRSYQANVQTIKTQDQAVQSLVNLR